MVLISTDILLKSDLTGTVVEKGARFIKVTFENQFRNGLLKRKEELIYMQMMLPFRRMEDNLLHLSTKGKNALEYTLKKKRDPKENKRKIY